uniref:Uncharacterized protein n=1 Tax=Amphora coffeiformis TaxID=265554 RepID=A0A7S3P3W1_9STRA|mmetsp:Transcript_2211/g.4423  ORF Transcript_2211/g.4423 Transcript_2211/m.4423 type:complete len:528 (-) Transcript_2211:56-1639(-)
MPEYDDDEAIARALQEQYNQEDTQQQRQVSARRSRSARTTNTNNVVATAPPEQVVRGQGISETDEEYARRVAREEERLYRYYQRRQQSHRSNNSSSSNNRPSAPIIPPPVPVDTNTSRSVTFDVCRSDSGDTHGTTSNEGSAVAEFEDEEYARRVEQELLDEEVARRYQENEEARASRVVARQVATERPPRYSFNCFCGYLVFATVIGAAVVAFFYFFYIQDNGKPRDWIWDPSDFADEDPFDAKKPDDVTPWRSNGRGLNVEVLNALEDNWDEFFYTAILDWDLGYPDSLTLSTATVEKDSNCHLHPTQGKVKVCNGDYGRTSWKGINEVHIDGSGYIYASTARLNDFYFDGNKGSMQYTMCHELGHAWGLPHTDETFGNKDLGNCMDYTLNEADNNTPDLSNYDFLFRLYGLVPDAEEYIAPTVAPSYAPLPTFAPIGELVGVSQQQEQSPGKNKDNGKTRSLEVVEDGYDEEIRASLADARERIMSGKRDGVRTVYRGSRGEVHEADMVKGHKLVVHKLLPTAR